MFPTRQGRESQDINFEQNQKSKSFVHALKSQLSGDMIGVINSVSGYLSNYLFIRTGSIMRVTTSSQCLDKDIFHKIFHTSNCLQKKHLIIKLCVSSPIETVSSVKWLVINHLIYNCNNMYVSSWCRQQAMTVKTI